MALNLIILFFSSNYDNKILWYWSICLLLVEFFIKKSFNSKNIFINFYETVWSLIYKKIKTLLYQNTNLILIMYEIIFQTIFDKNN